MKKFFVMVGVLAFGFCFVLVTAGKVQAGDTDSFGARLIAQSVGNQDPNAPDFAPGEKADGSAEVNSQTSSASTNSIPTATSSSSTPATANDTTSDGVGIGALFFSPIVGMFFPILAFLIVLGLIILGVVILVRRSNANSASSNQPIEAEKKNKPKDSQ